MNLINIIEQINIILQKKADTKEYILYDFIYIKFKKQLKLPCDVNSQYSSSHGFGKGGHA